MDRRAWWVTVLGVAKESDTTQQLNNNFVAVYNKSFSTMLNKGWRKNVGKKKEEEEMEKLENKLNEMGVLNMKQKK